MDATYHRCIRAEMAQVGAISKVQKQQKNMKVSENSKYQTHKTSAETHSKNPNDRTGGIRGIHFMFLVSAS